MCLAVLLTLILVVHRDYRCVLTPACLASPPCMHCDCAVEYYESFDPQRIVGYATQDDPATEVVADAASTLAAAVALFQNSTDPADVAWNQKAIEHATQLYNFATTYQKSYQDSKDPGMKVSVQNA